MNALACAPTLAPAQVPAPVTHSTVRRERLDDLIDRLNHGDDADDLMCYLDEHTLRISGSSKRRASHPHSTHTPLPPPNTTIPYILDHSTCV